MQNRFGRKGGRNRNRVAPIHGGSGSPPTPLRQIDSSAWLEAQQREAARQQGGFVFEGPVLSGKIDLLTAFRDANLKGYLATHSPQFGAPLTYDPVAPAGPEPRPQERAYPTATNFAEANERYDRVVQIDPGARPLNHVEPTPAGLTAEADRVVERLVGKGRS